MSLGMRFFPLFIMVLSILTPVYGQSKLTLTRPEYIQIGQRIWQNECAGTVNGLTSWNSGEEFMSLGIGHFIWYPKGKEYAFAESFPPFVKFAASKGCKLPAALLGAHPDCPWNTKAEFQKAFNSPTMTSIRTFLKDTVSLQAEFIAQRLEASLPKMQAIIAGDQRASIEKRFYLVAGTPGGMYALMDYVNFKGEGIKETERYKGQGWGLLQVLQGMKPVGTPEAALAEFRSSAAFVLRQRIKNSPPARGENRWEAGWMNRVDTYRN